MPAPEYQYEPHAPEGPGGGLGNARNGVEWHWGQTHFVILLLSFQDYGPGDWGDQLMLGCQGNGLFLLSLGDQMEDFLFGPEALDVL